MVPAKIILSVRRKRDSYDSLLILQIPFLSAPAIIFSRPFDVMVFGAIITPPTVINRI